MRLWWKPLLLSMALLTVPLRTAAADTLIFRKGSAVGKVAVSFDDGPHAEYTEEILDILSENGVHATFFVVGENVRAHPDIARRIVEEGHEIANHTDGHVFLKDLTLAGLCKEVQAASDSIESATGVKPRLFRPPGGSYSDSKVRALQEMGYVSVLWSKDTRDWTRPSVEAVVSRALDDLSDGDIILFHDFNGVSSPTPDALRQILPAVRQMGFEIVPVYEVLGLE